MRCFPMHRLVAAAIMKHTLCCCKAASTCAKNLRTCSARSLHMFWLPYSATAALQSLQSSGAMKDLYQWYIAASASPMPLGFCADLYM
jgi:hypothetical protein